jgi:hypothetical protein
MNTYTMNLLKVEDDMETCLPWHIPMVKKKKKKKKLAV